MFSKYIRIEQKLSMEAEKHYNVHFFAHLTQQRDYILGLLIVYHRFMLEMTVDVVKIVFKIVLKKYRPENCGIYCRSEEGNTTNMFGLIMCYKLANKKNWFQLLLVEITK